MSKSSESKNQDGDADLNLTVKFDLGEFEQRLAGVHQEFHDELRNSVFYKEPQQGEVPLNFNIPEADKAVQTKVFKEEKKEEPALSGLLASLALEAEQSKQNREVFDQEKKAANLRVHEGLDRVLKFFMPFIQHVNTVGPAIKRVYRLDARSVYASLKWQGALVDTRKQGMNDTSLLSYVTFSVNLTAPEPVLLKRPWSQYEAVVKELNHLKISSLDDLHAIHKRPQQEWLEARLDPALPVNILFRGNYELGKIDVLTRNLEDFGQTSFRLEPAEISSALLDELGMFLIARTDKLPAILQATPK